MGGAEDGPVLPVHERQQAQPHPRLRRPEAIEIVKRLVVGADVVWENFRGGVMDRLGLGYETLSALNPRLIYCSVSGFGRTGPERATAAFDGKLQAMSGIMSITGTEDNGPTRAGFALCDTIGGITAAMAVASALYQRTHTGRGQLVDVSMLTPPSPSSPDRYRSTPWRVSRRARSATGR
jgi:crotonobetainyl-CoA:carnitine CoA-transferase CaiB-like acyl-CoA transferase